jgi:hypothetical protein
MWSNRTETTIFPQGFICTYNLVKLDRKEGKKNIQRYLLGEIRIQMHLMYMGNGRTGP